MDKDVNISPDMINNLVNMLKNNTASMKNSSNSNSNNSNSSDGINNSSSSSNGINNNSHSNSNNNFGNNSNNNSSSGNSFDNIDLNTILKMKSIMDSLNDKNNPDSNLLYSLKPYLRKSRQDKLDQYINILKISQITKLFN